MGGLAPFPGRRARTSLQRQLDASLALHDAVTALGRAAGLISPGTARVPYETRRTALLVALHVLDHPVAQIARRAAHRRADALLAALVQAVQLNPKLLEDETWRRERALQLVDETWARRCTVLAR